MIVVGWWKIRRSLIFAARLSRTLSAFVNHSGDRNGTDYTATGAVDDLTILKTCTQLLLTAMLRDIAVAFILCCRNPWLAATGVNKLRQIALRRLNGDPIAGTFQPECGRKSNALPQRVPAYP
ncbi:hypothetical protein B0T21DRAFT_1972 [Apiosordaria backusii]|uniref:Uncharacterized protein n=1 Tax=Apiosordaria backusii TaxID=314023 RepID=A0AA40EXP2_9PEZI|nr:hypothetical protein B0T21DRAFT_1972 [Apiosordaria backusii]